MGRDLILGVSMLDTAKTQVGRPSRRPPRATYVIAFALTAFFMASPSAQSFELVAAAKKTGSDTIRVAKLCDPPYLDEPCLIIDYPLPCKDDNGADYGDPDLSDEGFNDRISSVAGFNNCWVVLFQHANYGGFSFTCESICDLPGGWRGMNNEASSYQLH